jgi:carbonic anhydrase
MLKDLLLNNKDWSKRRTVKDPNYFNKLADQQDPDYLWIGCSDSRVPANEIVGLAPGELFVHRNVANIAGPSDASCLSVLQYAVEALKVRHIIVCGHYGCGGVEAAVSGDRHGLIDHWLQPIRDVSDEISDELDALETKQQRFDRLCEANVIAQARSVASNPIVHDAWRAGQDVSVHAWIYSIRDGLLHDLKRSTSDFEDFAEQFPTKKSALLGAAKDLTE